MSIRTTPSLAQKRSFQSDVNTFGNSSSSDHDNGNTNDGSSSRTDEEIRQPFASSSSSLSSDVINIISTTNKTPTTTPTTTPTRNKKTIAHYPSTRQTATTKKNSVSSSVTSNDIEKFTQTKAFKVVLLTLLVFQASFALVVGRYTRTAARVDDDDDDDDDELYKISHLVLVIEVTKFGMSTVLESIQTNGHLLESLQEHVLQRPLDSFKVLVPAVLYVIQNSLIYIGLSNLHAPVFISLQQGKLIITALISVVMLQRSYSTKQWICLCSLAVGVAIVAMGEQKSKRTDAMHSNHTFIEEIEELDGMIVEEEETFLAEDAANQKFLVGFLAVMAGCFSSAFAGVYFEKVLAPEKAANPADRAVLPKSKTGNSTPAPPVINPPSLWVRNIQLSFFSIIFAFLQGLSDKRSAAKVASPDDFVDESGRITKSFLHGFTPWVWLLVLLQACGGLLVAAVMKYADNVLKGLACGLSVVVASLLSVILLQADLSAQFPLGATIIVGSVYFFANDLPTCCFTQNDATGGEKDETTNGSEMVPLQAVDEED